MKKLEEARKILQSVGMPGQQQSDICCYTLLAMSGVARGGKWAASSSEWIRIHDIIEFTREKFGVVYAENSRETFRKQALHHFRTAALIVDNGLATNSPNYRYRITEEFLTLLKNFGSAKWKRALRNFVAAHPSLVEVYASKKQLTKMPVNINDKSFCLSLGAHNRLQKVILEEFAPRFAAGCVCLYIGDTADKELFKNEETLKKLGFAITQHDKMPDVVLYRRDKDWLYFIEAVTSVGPMDAKRLLEINEMTKRVKSGKIFVTAFLDFKTYKRFSDKLTWETEVWIADEPDHMIHLNGDKFLGPRK